MIDATPDAVPVMDSSDEVKGLFIATGFSGHDLSRFRFSRFSDGSTLKLGPSI